MKILYFLFLAIVVLLSFSAGGAKITHAEQELMFFRTIGISTQWLLPFGVIQILGGLLSLLPRIRKLGLSIIAIMFALSAVMIFAADEPVFGTVSLIPIGVAILLALRAPKAPAST